MREAKNHGAVEMERPPVAISTYIPYATDKNPVFYEKRTYQDSSGRIYPIPIKDRLSHEKWTRNMTPCRLRTNTSRSWCYPKSEVAFM